MKPKQPKPITTQWQALAILLLAAAAMFIAGISFDRYLSGILMACGPNTAGEAIAFVIGGIIMLLLRTEI